MIIVLTLIISYIVNKLYENPFRKSNYKIVIIVIYIVSLSSLLTICLILFNYNANYMKNKYKGIAQNNNTTMNNNCENYCHIKSKNMIYSPNDIRKEWSILQNGKSICPFNSKSYLSNISKYPIILLLTDSHGEQWFNIIIPYAKQMNYIAIYIIFWQDTIYHKNFGKINKIFKLIPKVKYIVSAHLLDDKNDYNNFKINYFSYLKILLNHCDEVFVIHDTPHFDKNPNLCLLSTSNYDSCFAYLGKNATALKFPIYSSKRVNYIDMIPYICLNSYKCYYIWNSIPIYLDDNHLSLQYVKTLTKILLKHIIFENHTLKINLNCKESYKCSYKDDIQN